MVAVVLLLREFLGGDRSLLLLEGVGRGVEGHQEACLVVVLGVGVVPEARGVLVDRGVVSFGACSEAACGCRERPLASRKVGQRAPRMVVLGEV